MDLLPTLVVPFFAGTEGLATLIAPLPTVVVPFFAGTGALPTLVVPMHNNFFKCGIFVNFCNFGCAYLH